MSRFLAPWHDWIGSEQDSFETENRATIWEIVTRSNYFLTKFPLKGTIHNGYLEKIAARLVKSWRDFGLLWLVFKWFCSIFWMWAEARGLGFTKGGTWGLSIFVRRVSRVGINIVNTLGSEIESLEGSKASFVYSLEKVHLRVVRETKDRD